MSEATLIRHVHAREVLDSRGQPTVECEVHLAGGAMGRAIVPAGASTGQAEARELRDDDPRRYAGRGVRQAVQVATGELARAVLGCNAVDQRGVDRRLIECNDSIGSQVRERANALLGVSLATAHAAAAARKLPLYRHINELFVSLGRELFGAASPPTAVRMPLPMVNMISGGLHAGGNLDFQDFLILPVGAADYPTGLEWIVRVYRHLGRLLAAGGFEARLVGDEGGYGPRLKTNRQALEWLVRAVEAAELEPGRDVSLAVDVASSHFYDSQGGGRYRLQATGEGHLTSIQLSDYLESIVEQFPVVALEDPLAEEDWSGWQEITRRLGQRLTLIGDDLFATNPARLQKGIELGVANGVLIKLNQIGTLSETLQTMQLARQAGYRTIVSARSGETEDTTLADLAVGTAAEQIKIGSVARSERLAKYNQLLRIAEDFG